MAASFLALAAHRLAFGISTLLILLLFRYAFTDAGPFRSGLAGVGEAVVAGAAGLGVAALLTPWMVHHVGRPRTIQVGLLISAVAQLGLAALLSAARPCWRWRSCSGATGQMIKLCTDAAVQSEIGDELLGRVFALYDIVFNVGYVIAVAVAALLSPPDGRAPLRWPGRRADLLYLPGLWRTTWSCAAPAATRRPTPSATATSTAPSAASTSSTSQRADGEPGRRQVGQPRAAVVGRRRPACVGAPVAVQAAEHLRARTWPASAAPPSSTS